VVDTTCDEAAWRRLRAISTSWFTPIDEDDIITNLCTDPNSAICLCNLHIL